MKKLVLLALAGSLLSASAFAAMAPKEAPAEATGSKSATSDTAAMVQKAIDFLKSKQDASGGWNITKERPSFPAITALAIRGMLSSDTSADPMSDPAIASGVKFLLSKQNADGGIYDKVLPSYNTAISVVALSRINTPEAKEAVKKAVVFLRGIQFGEEGVTYAELEGFDPKVSKDHPFYGGVGYGHSGRPDLSNTAWWMEAMHSAGVEASDPAMKRAVVFLQRVQMLEATTDPATGQTVTVNDLDYANGSKQGGFVYSTSTGKDAIGKGESKAPLIEETLDDGTTGSRLRAYGSMTYSGFKSYMYAGLSATDPRVTAAYDWIRRNYTLEENPGVGTDGLYYYFVVFSRAMAARGEPMITTLVASDTGGHSGPKFIDGPAHDWAADLTARLSTLQQADGSFKSVDDRWMENDPVLITAYSLCALREAGK
jgi:squalene-hopene/tetraprenyl-beta-curcumene cyclase